MVRQLPDIHAFLVILPGLVQQDVDGARVSDVPVCLELLANGVAHVCWRDGQGVHGYDFWGLHVRVKGGEDS